MRYLLTYLIKANKAIARCATAAARFITENGTSIGEAIFWRVGGGMALFGATLTIISEVLALLNMMRSNTDLSDILPSLAITTAVTFITTHVAVALARCVFSPIKHSQ